MTTDRAFDFSRALVDVNISHSIAVAHDGTGWVADVTVPCPIGGRPLSECNELAELSEQHSLAANIDRNGEISFVPV